MPDSTGVSPSLDAARAALERGDGRAALTHLIAAWRDVRAPEIARLVAQLSARAAADRPLPETKQITKALVDWIARARELDPRDLDVLLDAFERYLHRCRPFQLTPCQDELLHRVEDPRLGPRLVAFITDPPQAHGLSVQRVWTRFGQLVARCGDPRVIAPLEALIGRSGKDVYHRHFLNQRLPGYLGKLKARASGLHTALDAQLVPTCEALSRLIARAELREPALTEHALDSDVGFLAAIRADPRDDELRLVYADWLQERGEPRGEFIALQYQRRDGPLSRKAGARERALLKRHRDDWLGGLANIILKRSIAFERGFLTACQIKPIKLFQRKTEAEHVDWATVERVEFAPDSYSIVSPHMRGIREMYHVCERGVIDLTSRHADLPVDTLSYHGDGYINDDGRPGSKALAALAACDGLPGLRHLELGQIAIKPRHTHGLTWLWQCPIGQRLHTFTSRLGTIHEWTELDLPIQVLRLIHRRGDLIVELRRGPDQRLTHATARLMPSRRNPAASVASILADLLKRNAQASKLTSLRVEVAGTEVDVQQCQSRLAQIFRKLPALDTFDVVVAGSPASST